jgi:hypothetical protein
MSFEAEVHSITGVGTALSTDQKSREVRYLWSMSIRTLCFIGAVIASGALRWVLLAGAALLPYFAVIIANAGRERGAWKGNGAFTDSNPKMELPNK